MFCWYCYIYCLRCVICFFFLFSVTGFRFLFTVTSLCVFTKASFYVYFVGLRSIKLLSTSQFIYVNVWELVLVTRSAHSLLLLLLLFLLYQFFQSITVLYASIYLSIYTCTGLHHFLPSFLLLLLLRQFHRHSQKVPIYLFIYIFV